MQNHRKYIPRLVFWETTKKCNLSCQHCRAIPESELQKEELSTKEAFRLFDEIAEFSNPIIILSGGEPLYRSDIFEIAEYGKKKGFRMSLATNGTLVDRDMAKRIADMEFARVSVSLDGADAATHDNFRAIPGSFEKAVSAIRYMDEFGVSTQINTTIAKHNYLQMPEILKLALELNVDALHTFLLVPVGCGVNIADEQMLPASEYEKILNWFYDESKKVDIDLKATCAPHYFRVRAERILEEKKAGKKPTPFISHGTKLKAGHVDKQTIPKTKDGIPASGHGLSAMTKGCLAATGICFISNLGGVFPCGYLPVMAGDIRKKNFKEIWDDSKVFEDLRNPELLKGKCGICEFKHICEGCRARAFGATGDYLNEEPFCAYEPNKKEVREEDVVAAHTEAEEALPEIELSWSDDAKEALKKIPGFVRKKAAKNIEEYARQKNVDRVTPEIMQDARKSS